MRYTHPDLPGFLSPGHFTLGSGDEAIKYAMAWWDKATGHEIASLGFLEFVPPEPDPLPAPDLKPYQFWGVLRATGHEAPLRTWVASLNDPGTEQEPNPNYDPVTWAHASAMLDFSLEYRRDHPLVEAARQAMGISEGELNDLWGYAASL